MKFQHEFLFAWKEAGMILMTSASLILSNIMPKLYTSCFFFKNQNM